MASSMHHCAGGVGERLSPVPQKAHSSAWLAKPTNTDSTQANLAVGSGNSKVVARIRERRMEKGPQLTVCARLRRREGALPAGGKLFSAVVLGP